MALKRRKDNNNRVLKEGEYQRKNGTYEYKWRDRRGKRHSVYAKTLTELREKENNLLGDVLDGIRTDIQDITINDLYYRWVQLKKGLKPNVFRNYKYSYSHFVEPDFGNTHIDGLKRSEVRAFYNYLHDTMHLKVSTIDCIHTVLHQVLELGVEDDYLRYNPSDNALKELMKAHNNETQRRKALSISEQLLFEDFLAQQGQYHKWYNIFKVMLDTGLRVGEVTGLRWDDIDIEEGTISINHTLVYYDRGGKERCGYGINTPKSKAGERTIEMTPKVKEAFINERLFQEEIGLCCNVEIDGYTNFIFINRFGGVQQQSTLNKALRRIIRDCNYEVMDKGGMDAVTLPRFSCHSLRHTFATRLCEAGINVKAIQDALGHSDPVTTLGIYSHVTKEMKKAELNKYVDYYNGMKDIYDNY